MFRELHRAAGAAPGNGEAASGHRRVGDSELSQPATCGPRPGIAGVAGFGLAFGWWVTVCSAPFFMAAVVHEVYAQRKRVSLG